ncbi:MAG: 4-(cytidine 5'-diphospho)-2-C-methyl-D-erythritol kinase, partial [Campylobacter sp.]|nr:4-(cytidine 5'-diphospho)-2-C-methyl-D-erythritol kinase [Campylobacter sp.]
NLYDEISFIDGDDKIISNCEIYGENIILKARKILEKFGYKNELDEFFKTHSVKIVKNIPMGAGLGGGSSNAAAFLKLANNTLNLNISKPKLLEISTHIGSDVAFFISGYKSANVTGIGEIVKEFNESALNLEIISPKIHSNTAQIYQEFRANFMYIINPNLAKNLAKLQSAEILENYKNLELNDLLHPFLKLNPNFSLKEKEFLSGSGSSYFRRVF